MTARKRRRSISPRSIRRCSRIAACRPLGEKSSVLLVNASYPPSYTNKDSGLPMSHRPSVQPRCVARTDPVFGIVPYRVPHDKTPGQDSIDPTATVPDQGFPSPTRAMQALFADGPPVPGRPRCQRPDPGGSRTQSCRKSDRSLIGCRSRRGQRSDGGRERPRRRGTRRDFDAH